MLNNDAPVYSSTRISAQTFLGTVLPPWNHDLPLMIEDEFYGLLEDGKSVEDVVILMNYRYDLFSPLLTPKQRDEWWGITTLVIAVFATYEGFRFPPHIRGLVQEVIASRITLNGHFDKRQQLCGTLSEQRRLLEAIDGKADLPHIEEDKENAIRSGDDTPGPSQKHGPSHGHKHYRRVVPQVIEYMVGKANRQPDGSGAFHGSPRGRMESISSSGGSAYNRLYDLGFVRVGTGSKGTWSIPKEFMAG